MPDSNKQPNSTKQPFLTDVQELRSRARASLDKGPITPMVAVLTILALVAADRRVGWLKRLNWYWGLVLVAAVVGPWAGAVTVATDGAFWTTALTGDLAPKLAGGQETHGAPPGYHTLLAPLLLFPMTLMLPTADAVTKFATWLKCGASSLARAGYRHRTPSPMARGRRRNPSSGSSRCQVVTPACGTSSTVSIQGSTSGMNGIVTSIRIRDMLVA